MICVHHPRPLKKRILSLKLRKSLEDFYEHFLYRMGQEKFKCQKNQGNRFIKHKNGKDSEIFVSGIKIIIRD